VSESLWTNSTQSQEIWLPITEYAVKAGISLSTIRRRIKANSLTFRLDKGKYWIRFETDAKLHTAPQPAEPIQRPSTPTAKAPLWDRQQETRISSPTIVSPRNDSVETIRTAYEQSIKEKNTRLQTLQSRNQELEDRVTELQHLIQVLEEKFDVQY